MKKLLFLTLIIIFSLALAQAVYAQDNALVDNPADTTTDEITAADFEASEPTVLPTNTFGYFLKNLGRTIKTAVTFNQEKKAELQLNYANERLLEAKKMAELNPNDAKVQEKIEKNHEKYQQLMEKVHERVQEIKAKNDDRAENLIDKITDSEFKQQKLMETIQEQVRNMSEEQEVKLQQYKETALEKLGNFIENVDGEKNKVRERLESVLAQKDDKLDHLKDLEIMERLGDKFNDENLKEGLIEAKEKIRADLVDYLNERPEISEAQRFELKLKAIGNDEAYKLRVMNFVGEELKEEIKTNWQLNQFKVKLDEVKEDGIDYLKEKLENAKSAEVREKLLKPLESGEMNSVNVLESVKARVTNSQAKEALDGAQEKQIEQFNLRIEKVDDSERLEKLKGEINAEPVIKQRFLKAEPQILNDLDKKIQDFKVKQDVEFLEAKPIINDDIRAAKPVTDIKPILPPNNRADEPGNVTGDATDSGSFEPLPRPINAVEPAREPLRIDQPGVIKPQAEPAR